MATHRERARQLISRCKIFPGPEFSQVEALMHQFGKELVGEIGQGYSPDDLHCEWAIAQDNVPEGGKPMGQVRDTITSPTDKSPLVKLGDVKEQLYDLLQTKQRDLASEGDAMKGKNQASIDKIREAIKGVVDAEFHLKAY